MDVHISSQKRTVQLSIYLLFSFPKCFFTQGLRVKKIQRFFKAFLLFTWFGWGKSVPMLLHLERISSFQWFQDYCHNHYVENWNWCQKQGFRLLESLYEQGYFVLDSWYGFRQQDFRFLECWCESGYYVQGSWSRGQLQDFQGNPVQHRNLEKESQNLGEGSL